LEWTPQDGRNKVGRPKRTWQDTLNEDLEEMGVDSTQVTRERLPTIVPDGDNSLPDALYWNRRTKSK